MATQAQPAKEAQPEKPSLHELAALRGFGRARDEVRKHYDPLFGMTTGDRTFRVTFPYTVREECEASYEVKAANEAEAVKIANVLLDKDSSVPFDAEFDDDERVAEVSA